MAENKDGIEKSEEASAKRLQDAKEKGQVAKSKDVTSASIMLIGGISVFLLGKNMMLKLTGIFSSAFSTAGQFDFTDSNLQFLLISQIESISWLIFPILLIIVAIVLAAEIPQAGLFFATKKFTEAENWQRPFKILSGVKRTFFSSRSLVELLKSFLKVVVLGGVAYSVISGNLDKIVGSADLPFISVVEAMADVAFELIIKVGGLFIFIAAADFIYQKWKFKQDMKMTKQEVKDETKQMEGDQQIKYRLRQMGRNMIRKKMIQAVPTASVIITNPTHFAVAIKYNQGEDNAPVVVAKGVDFLAQKIKEIGANNNVRIVEDPPLARVLYKLVDVDSTVPEILFKAVAQVLAFVYQVKAGNNVEYNPSNINENDFY
ncbi:MAG: flagellar biosynthesis protein FlhB [Bacteroidetes bacterium]|nr:flagellar biosynthesis protein FlhB [Bacteroidota bacterium]